MTGGPSFEDAMATATKPRGKHPAKKPASKKNTTKKPASKKTTTKKPRTGYSKDTGVMADLFIQNRSASKTRGKGRKRLTASEREKFADTKQRFQEALVKANKITKGIEGITYLNYQTLLRRYGCPEEATQKSSINIVFKVGKPRTPSRQMVEAMGRAIEAFEKDEKVLRLFQLPESASMVTNVTVPKDTVQQRLLFVPEDTAVKNRKSYCHSFVSHMTVMCERNYKRKYEISIERELRELAADPKTSYHEFKLDFDEPIDIRSISDAVEKRIGDREAMLKRSNRTFKEVEVPQIQSDSEDSGSDSEEESNREDMDYSDPPSPERHQSRAAIDDDSDSDGDFDGDVMDQEETDNYVSPDESEELSQEE